MKISLKKAISMILMAAVITTSGVFISGSKAEAAETYIKVDAYAKSIASELGLSPVSGPQKSQYVNALIDKGIIKEGDFSSYSSYLTRTDAAVLLNRADEFLNGNTLDAELVSLALEKRISDIKSIKESKRTDVVKCYLKGIIKGYSNGNYSSDRAYKGSSKISKTGALDCIKLLKNASLRAKISPDGQLIRTTKLPKNAKLYPYILASYPNKYYEWELKYQTIARLNENEKMINLVDYASPAEIDKLNLAKYNDFSSLKKLNLNKWVENAKKHIELVFNVDYRTMNDDWYNAILKTNYQYGTSYEWFPKKKLDEYIKKMKPNKTIVEYDKIAIDGSSLYYYEYTFYLRLYVKYRIISSSDLSIPDGDTPLSKWSYDKILFSNGFADIGGYTLGEWKEGYYNIMLGDNYSEGNLGVLCVDFDPGRVID